VLADVPGDDEEDPNDEDETMMMEIHKNELRTRELV
jgi:hypothetical protein